MANIPETQRAVQLIGPDELVFNKSKEVFRPGRHQILCRVEAVGLCFSDLKLLKQFSSHVRKGGIVSGIAPEVLKEVSSYVPDSAPTVPGHEAVVRIEAVGPDVENFKPGQRYVVQTDYRWLRTAGSNAAFGYNFEGALQEYVLMDERVILSPAGDSMLVPVCEELSASAAALVEPWACVEDAYASRERRSLKPGGQMLVVADPALISTNNGQLKNMRFAIKKLVWDGRPAQITWVSKADDKRQTTDDRESTAPSVSDGNTSELADAGYDDVIYFGCCAETVEMLFTKVGPQGLFNIVLCGGKLDRDVAVMVGRVHYSGVRIVGTTGSDPAESMKYIPETGEIRAGDKINVIGAGGPMGMMHVIRNIWHLCPPATDRCGQGIEGISVFAGDVDEGRLAALTKIAAPLAEKNGVEFRAYNPTKDEIGQTFDYTVLMVPIPDLVAASVRSAASRGIINIFAGIPATVSARINLDGYIEKQLYFIGTSGSVLEDMKRVLAKVESGRLDTCVCIAAVSGLEGAAEGIRAVENRLIAGKIIVYPSCKGLGLVPLEKLSEKMPEVAECLNNGLWTKQAERKLLEKYQ